MIGLGGIATGADALEFIVAGAAAVQVGTANFMDPAPAGGSAARSPNGWRPTGVEPGGDPGAAPGDNLYKINDIIQKGENDEQRDRGS